VFVGGRRRTLERRSVGRHVCPRNLVGIADIRCGPLAVLLTRPRLIRMRCVGVLMSPERVLLLEDVQIALAIRSLVLKPWAHQSGFVGLSG